MLLNEFARKIIKKDRRTFFKDLSSLKSKDDNFEDNYEKTENIKGSHKNFKNQRPIIADFTEYSPLHKGHFHCMKIAKSKIPNGIFVAIIPGLFERSGRGLPYIMTRHSRAKIAIEVGADIVVEGPPMGIMGSGQYSLCLAKMFKTLKTDFIPRGYKPFDGFNLILERISIGHGVAPKPYKIVDNDVGEILYEGKLEEDNYVIASLSKSLKKIGFDFKNKFLFVKRIEGVSGTLIREATSSGNFEKVKDMMPSETVAILKNEIKNNRAPLHKFRDIESILDSANNLSFEDLKALNLIDNKTASAIIEEREKNSFDSISQLQDCISYGFSTHFNHRVLSVLEAKINKDIISNYIERYPINIRILNYKNEDVLEEFKDKIDNDNRRLELWQ